MEQLGPQSQLVQDGALCVVGGQEGPLGGQEVGGHAGQAAARKLCQEEGGRCF